jgi:pyruvate dehydrogenase (quinone)/pyruvate oxidase
LHATQELEELAEALGAPIIKALLGKAAVPDDSPYTTGGIGLLGTEPSQDAIEGCDTLLMVGTSFPYIEFLPEPGSIKCVQVDIDPQRISLRHPADVGLIGDAKNTLRTLLPLLEKHDKGFLEKAQKAKAEWQKLMEERGTRPDKPMKPRWWVGNWASVSLRTRSLPRTPERSQPGGRGMYPPCAGRSTAAREISQPWHAACPMLSLRPSHTLIGLSTASSETAASVCCWVNCSRSLPTS